MSKIFEINKLLDSLDRLSRGEKVHIDNLKSNYNEKIYANETVDSFDSVLRFSTQLELIELDGSGYVHFMRDGRELLDKMTMMDNTRILDPNQKQSEFLSKIFFEIPMMAVKLAKLVDSMKIDYSKRPPTWIGKIDKNIDLDNFLIGFLEEIGTFQIDENKVECLNNFSSISAIKNRRIVSEQELEQQLEQNKEHGKLGEELTITFERNRLKKEGRIDLSFDIKHLSLVDEFAGYDIMSYNDKNSKLSRHDRMIEVKATTNSKPRFFWSSNESKAAKEYGENYWIYVWTNINSELKRKLHTIQNPYKRIHVNHEWNSEVQSWKVTKR